MLQENGTDKLYLESTDEGLLDPSNTESIGIKPSPLDSEPDDDFGFSVSIDGTETGWT